MQCFCWGKTYWEWPTDHWSVSVCMCRIVCNLTGESSKLYQIRWISKKIIIITVCFIRRTWIGCGALNFRKIHQCCVLKTFQEKEMMAATDSGMGFGNSWYLSLRKYKVIFSLLCLSSTFSNPRPVPATRVGSQKFKQNSCSRLKYINIERKKEKNNNPEFCIQWN